MVKVRRLQTHPRRRAGPTPPRSTSTRGQNVSSLFGDSTTVVVSATATRTVDPVVESSAPTDAARTSSTSASGTSASGLHPAEPADGKGPRRARDDVRAHEWQRPSSKSAVRRMMMVLMDLPRTPESPAGRSICSVFTRRTAHQPVHPGRARIPGRQRSSRNIQRYGNTTAATIPILLAEEPSSGKNWKTWDEGRDDRVLVQGSRGAARSPTGERRRAEITYPPRDVRRRTRRIASRSPVFLKRSPAYVDAAASRSPPRTRRIGRLLVR